MPYAIIKNKNKSTYKVVNKDTGKVHAKNTTKLKAEKQIKLLQYIDNNISSKNK